MTARGSSYGNPLWHKLNIGLFKIIYNLYVVLFPNSMMCQKSNFIIKRTRVHTCTLIVIKYTTSMGECLLLGESVINDNVHMNKHIHCEPQFKFISSGQIILLKNIVGLPGQESKQVEYLSLS